VKPACEKPADTAGWASVIVTGALTASPVALVGSYAVNSLMQTDMVQNGLAQASQFSMNLMPVGLTQAA
jgi:hypothetical protein